MSGIFNTIKIDSTDDVLSPNDFTLDREDVFEAEYISCTGKTIADRIGWKYADMSLQWDTLPQSQLAILLSLTGEFTITFIDENGSSVTENVIRKGTGMTGTRFTDDSGDAIWKGVTISISFLDVH